MHNHDLIIKNFGLIFTKFGVSPKWSVLKKENMNKVMEQVRVQYLK